MDVKLHYVVTMPTISQALPTLYHLYQTGLVWCVYSQLVPTQLLLCANQVVVCQSDSSVPY